MIVDSVALSFSDATTELSAFVRPERRPREAFQFWYRFPAGLYDEAGAEPDASAFIAALLPLCMQRRERLVVEGRVSERLLDSLPAIQEILVNQSRQRDRLWTVRLDPVEVGAEPRRWSPGPNRTAQFFTRGVDSWFSLLSLDGDPDEPSHLAWSPSADRQLGPESAERSVELIAEAARTVGRQFVRIDTNIRLFTDERIRWTELHPCGFASIGLALSGAFGVAIFSTMFSGPNTIRWGAERLASLWSTERVRIVDYGTTTLKFDKARRVAASQLALNRLKVCLHGDTPLNCGICEKCCRTMGMLYAVGALERCPTFERPFELERLAKAGTTNAGASAFVETLLRVLGDSPREIQVRHSLEASRNGRTWRDRAAASAQDRISFIDKMYARGALRRAYHVFR